MLQINIEPESFIQGNKSEERYPILKYTTSILKLKNTQQDTSKSPSIVKHYLDTFMFRKFDK